MRVLGLLWLAPVILLIFAVILARRPVPLYSSGVAVVVTGQLSAPAHDTEVSVVGFFPAQDLSRFRPGQSLLLHADRALLPERAEIRRIEPVVLSPADAARRFALESGTAQFVSQPVACIIAVLKRSSADPPASPLQGGIYRADVKVGVTSPLTLLPTFIAQFFGVKT